MKNLIGTYACKIDDKGYLKLPSSLVRQMEESGCESFVIKRSVFQPCLEVYPMKAWEKLMKKINKLNRFQKKNADFTRQFTAGLKTLEPDNATRLQISKDLTLFANLKNETVIASTGELFEIWDKEAYENVIATNENDFAILAEEIMGEINFYTEN
jgi:MraZ protein